MKARAKDVWPLIREVYPKHSKQAFSLASRSSETGVMFTPGAQAIISAAVRGKQAKEPYRRYTYRVYGRIPQETGERIKSKLTARGATMQDLLFALLTTWVEEG